MGEKKEISEYLYIDKDVHIQSGDAARKAIERHNDYNLLTPDSGIIQVPQDRWKEAQHAERTHWMKLGLRTWNDRNDDHYRKFAKYETLQGRIFDQALEIGCGPFTNLSIIGSVCKIRSAYLLDPLIQSYLLHPYCTYTETNLITRQVQTRFLKLHRLASRLFTNLHAQIFKRLIRVDQIPIRQLLPIPAEEMPQTLPPFDLIVAINVIEHCYDIGKVFASMSHLRPGGVLVFQDKYYDHESVAQWVQSVYDAAHPLKVDRKIIDSFITENFRPLYRQVYSGSNTVSGVIHSSEDVYFIGEKF